VWLFQIAANLWRDQVRREKRRPKRAHCPMDEQQGTARLPDQAVTDREDVRRVLVAMDRLPSRQREVLYLHACEGLSLVQIAEVLGISPDAVKASLSLARKRMRLQLKDLCRDRFPTP
jgi:RNA polymerase sigma-70 factor (ECF subfamily)